jgi:hypothetical protein
MTRRGLAALLVSGASGLAGCGGGSEPAGPDARLVTHVLLPGTPTAEGLAFVRAVADVHVRADASTDASERATILRAGLDLPVPPNVGEAEILRLELASRLGETLLAAGRAAEVRALLADMLDPEQSLPVDRAAAHALVVLGDAALEDGDDALAAGSYARALRIMSMLREELRP